jgi:hypothetical protein
MSLARMDATCDIPQNGLFNGPNRFYRDSPHEQHDISTLVAVLGTTISPHLFFWQASEEVEEELLAIL